MHNITIEPSVIIIIITIIIIIMIIIIRIIIISIIIIVIVYARMEKCFRLISSILGCVDVDPTLMIVVDPTLMIVVLMSPRRRS